MNLPQLNDHQLKSKVDKLLEFIDKTGIDYSKYNNGFDFSKRQAYPNTDVYMHIPGQHNTKKWLQAVQEIFYLEKDDGRVKAIRKVTAGWNLMETYDFLNWLKFHEAGDHMKYKFAQRWYENGDYILPIKPDPVQKYEPPVSGIDFNNAQDGAADSMSKSERKSIIEKQRNKIIGRLDSAEKLLRSPDGQVFSGKEFEILMEAIYQLKKKIQMVNKISSSTRLYEDMIVCQANILNRDGFIKAAEMLFSVAQPAVAPTPPAPPSQGQGAVGGLPSTGPGMAQNPPESGPSQAMSDFLKNMDTAKITTPEDKNGSEDDLEVEDVIDVEEAEDDLLVTEAQGAPPMDIPMTSTPAPAPLDPSPIGAPEPLEEPKKPSKLKDNLKPVEPLEVTEDDIKPKHDTTPSTSSEFDSKVDAVLAGITVADVVAKLEDLAKIFKTREVPRQLGIVDMMLDSLGLASYFPSLSEAQNKALDSNNYISTRVEDIISKLRGAMDNKDIDLKGTTKTESPEVAGIKSKLQESENKEKARKQMRKDQESAEMAGVGKETPNVEINEDLGAPPAPPPPIPKPPPPLT